MRPKEADRAEHTRRRQGRTHEEETGGEHTRRRRGENAAGERRQHRQQGRRNAMYDPPIGEED